MAHKNNEFLAPCRDWTQKNRNWILYAAGILTLFGVAGGVDMLPAQVAIRAVQEGQQVQLVDKYTALGAAGGITLLFAVLFALRPRELIYFIALWLGVFLVYSLLLINLVV